MKKLSNAGFTLIELLITIAIIGIIAAIAVPSYMNYTKKAEFSEIVQSSAPYKLGVSSCIQEIGETTGCNAGSHNIPDIADLSGNQNTLVNSINVADGVITITPKAKEGFSETDTYVLTPTMANGMITWSPSGDGYVHYVR